MTTVLARRSAQLRAEGEALIRQADRLISESWNEKMWPTEGLSTRRRRSTRRSTAATRGFRSSARGAGRARHPSGGAASRFHDLHPRPGRQAALPGSALVPLHSDYDSAHGGLGIADWRLKQCPRGGINRGLNLRNNWSFQPLARRNLEFNLQEFSMNKAIISLALGASALFATAASAARSQMASRLCQTTESKTSAWSVINPDAAGGIGVRAALSFRTRTTTRRANVTSNSADTMMAGTIIAGRASGSALDRVA